MNTLTKIFTWVAILLVLAVLAFVFFKKDTVEYVPPNVVVTPEVTETPMPFYPCLGNDKCI